MRIGSNQMKRGIYFLCIGLSAFWWSCQPEASQSTPSFQERIQEIRYYRNSPQRDSINTLLDKAFAKINEPKPLDYFAYYDLKCWYYKDIEDRETALAYADSQIIAVREIDGAEKDYVHGLISKGYMLREHYRYSESLTAYYQAELLSEKYLDDCAASEANSSIGSVLYRKGDYGDALNYYRKAIQLVQDCSDTMYQKKFISLQAMYNSSGISYQKLGLQDSAIAYFQKALDFIEAGRDKFPRDQGFIDLAEAVIKGNYGESAMELGQFDMAERLFKESIAINSQETYDNRDAFFTELKYLNLLRRMGRIQEMKVKLDSLELLPLATKNKDAAIRINWAKSRYYESIGNRAEAFKYYKAYQEKSDSLAVLKKGLDGVDYKRIIENVQQKDRLAELKDREHTKNLLLVLALVLSVFLLLIVYLVRRNLRESNKHILLLNRLYSEKEEQNKQLNLTMDNLRASQDEYRRVMRIIAHDLRSPVSSIVSLSNLALADQSSLAEKNEYIAMIERLAKDSLGFMEDVLNLRPESGNVLNKQAYPVLDLVQYCAGFMRLRAEEKKQKIEVKGPEVIADIDKEKMWRVFTNLMSNALKFSNEGETIRVSIKDLSDKVSIEFSDKGIGIPEALKDKVFDMLSEAKRPGTEGEKTYGIGLHISKQIVEDHGGSLRFESQEGQGSTFFVDLPKH